MLVRASWSWCPREASRDLDIQEGHLLGENALGERSAVAPDSVPGTRMVVGRDLRADSRDARRLNPFQNPTQHPRPACRHIV